MRAPPFVERARHYGVRAYEHARHGLSGINRAVETGARLYGGVVQPLLKHGGYDTRDVDDTLMNLYAGWGGARDLAEKFDALL
jgi:hypothetical protein